MPKKDDKFPSDSRDGFSPNIWAPSLWFFLHIISINFPPNPTDQEKKDYMHFLFYVGKVMPCGTCRNHFQTDFDELGGRNLEYYKNRKIFSRFIYKMHKNINKKNTDKKLDIGYSKLMQKYELYRANKKIKGAVAICPVNFSSFFSDVNEPKK